MTNRIQGGCFCGSIRYELLGTLCHARSCHCSRCRKAFSGAGSAYAEVSPGSAFRWVSGFDILKQYSTGEDWGMAFCSNCGTTLCGMYRDQVHGLTLGSVDGDPGVQIEQHIFVGSKAPWDHIGGEAPQFDEHAH
jgi:hypothetical protein